jgi:anaerobic nitric oxide reductase transcription regulator
MTTSRQGRAAFERLLPELLGDLSSELSGEERYRRLLAALRRIVPCDAVALLQLQGDTLKPLAVNGLSEDTLGRHFTVAEQPRLSRILLSREPVRVTDATLPDPYDGLIEGGPDVLPVHDCMGAALYVDGQPWGVLTLDSLRTGGFNRIDLQVLRAFLRLAEASVKITHTIDTLRARVAREHEVNQALQAAHTGADELLGKSAVMQRLRREIDTVAASDLVVLILGETGVGKELVARQLHVRSHRAGQPMVHVNCAALPETLAESELFGHRKGAFTGAVSNRPGKFELADGGTLFLDEVGELPLAIQAKLLRALQSGEIQRPGSDETLHADVRIVAATNRDLKQEVAAGRFRADLYHRLSVFPLQVPPLRERGRDALALAGFFLEHNQRRLHVRNVRLATEARDALLHYDWPGNVRELEHVMSRAALLATSEQGRQQRWITVESRHLGLHAAAAPEQPAATEQSPLPATTLAEAVAGFQRRWLTRAIEENRGNLAAAARAAGMDRSNFFRLLKRMGIETRR